MKAMMTIFREDSWKHFDAGSSGLKISDASEVLLVSKLRALSGPLPYAFAFEETISKLNKHASVTFKQCSHLGSSSKLLYFITLICCCCCLHRALFGLIVSTEHLTHTLSGEPAAVTCW